MTEKLDVFEFGRRLIESNDLDPVYVLLWQASLPEEKLKKWLLAYWCFYHMGTASWVADHKQYWGAMETAAGSKDYPRSSERRHFRGKNAADSVAYLRGRGIDKLFAPLLKQGYIYPLREVTNLVEQWRGFGPWIAFKVADMLERLGLVQVNFLDSDLLFYDSPQKGAELVFKILTSEESCAERLLCTESPDEGVTEWAISRLLQELGHLKAPPRYERGVNVQEMETVLCKYHSYSKGHYELGEDIEHCRTGLIHYRRESDTVDLLLQAGEEAGLWQL